MGIGVQIRRAKSCQILKMYTKEVAQTKENKSPFSRKQGEE